MRAENISHSSIFINIRYIQRLVFGSWEWDLLCACTCISLQIKIFFSFQFCMGGRVFKKQESTSKTYQHARGRSFYSFFRRNTARFHRWWKLSAFCKILGLFRFKKKSSTCSKLSWKIFIDNFFYRNPVLIVKSKVLPRNQWLTRTWPHH